MTARPAPIWDLGVRGFHWALVVASAVALLTGFLAPWTWLRLHLIAGAVIAGLLWFRTVWGVLGPHYARFASFAPRPAAIVHHLRGVIGGRPTPSVGHNPLGSLMVFGLLLVSLAICGTGVVALGGYLKQGPLAAFLSFATGRTALSLHNALAILLAVMIGAHLAGVAMETLLTRENLVRAMITGRKHAAVAPMPANSFATRLALCLVLIGLCAGSAAIAALAQLSGRGVPPSTEDPNWASQCAGCHFAYPPSLSPGWVWARILDDLQHHFGNADASLSPDLVAQLRTYALANGADHWDTLPAHAFRLRDPADPLRITATPFWRRLHRGIPDRVFKQSAVGSRAACDACHHDAETARFAPQAIAIP